MSLSHQDGKGSTSSFNAYHRVTTSDPTSSSLAGASRFRPAGVSRLIKGFINMNSKNDDGPPGLLYHIAELPRGHSRKSMVEMLQAITEWAKENPEPGKRPNLNATSPSTLVADEVQYPDGPTSYDLLSYPVESNAICELDTEEPESKLLQPRLESYSIPRLDWSRTTAEDSISGEVPNGNVLISLSNEHDLHDDRVCTNLQLLTPGFPRTTTESTSQRPIEYGQSPNKQTVKDNDGYAQAHSSVRYLDASKDAASMKVRKWKKSNVREIDIPRRTSSQQTTTHKYPDQYLGVGPRPVATSVKTNPAGVTDSALPENFRIARLEASAQVVKRRPVRENKRDHLKKDNNDRDEAASDLVSYFDPHKPVGLPLSKEEMAEMCEPDLAAAYTLHYQYKPYKPTSRITISNATSNQQIVHIKPRLRHVESISFGGGRNGESQANINVQRSRDLSKQSNKVSQSACSPSGTPKLPYLPTTFAFDQDEALVKWLVAFDEEKQSADSTKGKALAPILTPAITVSPPTPIGFQMAQATLYETLYPASTSRPEQYKSVPNTFRRSLSRGTAMRLLEVEPGFDFDAATMSSKSYHSNIISGQAPTQSQQDAAISKHEHKADTQSSSTSASLNTSDKVVRERVQHFEPKTREVIVNENVNINNSAGNFVWPRFSDREYVDPASEHAEKWKQIRKTRRRGMIFDPQVVEQALNTETVTFE